ncbi:glycoside hydrolase family 43 protein [Bacillus sp. CLL-7-23]|uniref:Glycoside hydrolase family 43 protein n=1 Tax=Bacillus changyiensis TaxID=3004103 RepID=A0ABT4WYS4_9BACI|nr:glycoside hydrolase family 43 protein [Bacillus changyiensis]MDA7025187.1 glycoside hydrolase family 43 protein [Bacillus changyiensis]
MKKYLLRLFVILTICLLPSPVFAQIQKPDFHEVSVHDPSVIKVNNAYYVFGSHLASAKSTDLMKWKQISSSVDQNNPLIRNVYHELNEAFTWAETKTLWAADVRQLGDGKFYMYYNACRGDSPRSALGIAVADNVEGPYRNKGIFLKSGMDGLSQDGTKYDATKHPNAVDPHTFYDKKGKLWMVYGSYSGGIFILKMDRKTGLPLPNQGYGKKLIGGNHSRIEGAYILYHPKTHYYYMFMSFGGLDAVGGYNIRVVRSKNPDGPYYDAEGHEMVNLHGKPGTIFDDRSIEPYGVKLMGNFSFKNKNGTDYGYVSPGHNSAYYDEKSGKSYLIFHTRFPGRGEEHQVRVHQMMMNKKGWPVVAPHRYAGESLKKVNKQNVVGEYKLIQHGKDISAHIKKQLDITLNPNGKVSGAVTGRWKITGSNNIELDIYGKRYDGVFLQQWDSGSEREVMTFSGLSHEGDAVWGSKK